MYATMGSYAVEVVGTSGASDKVEGLGMGTPQEPHVKHHTSFGLTYVERPEQDDSEEPPEEEEDPKEEEDTKPKPEPKPEPDDKDAPEVDPRVESLLTLALDGDTYDLVKVVWMDPDESHGLHHIFVDVVDKDGRRLAGEKIRVSWSDGETVIPVEEKPGEPWGGNYAMYATMGAYAVEVVGTSGASDKVGGLGMGTPQEPHIKHHTSFGLTFRKQIS
jgi:hypothetical protein